MIDFYNFDALATAFEKCVSNSEYIVRVFRSEKYTDFAKSAVNDYVKLEKYTANDILSWLECSHKIVSNNDSEEVVISFSNGSKIIFTEVHYGKEFHKTCFCHEALVSKNITFEDAIYIKNKLIKKYFTKADEEKENLNEIL